MRGKELEGKGREFNSHHLTLFAVSHDSNSDESGHDNSEARRMSTES
jgi:hypothetical protein